MHESSVRYYSDFYVPLSYVATTMEVAYLLAFSFRRT